LLAPVRHRRVLDLLELVAAQHARDPIGADARHAGQQGIDRCVAMVGHDRVRPHQRLSQFRPLAPNSSFNRVRRVPIGLRAIDDGPVGQLAQALNCLALPLFGQQPLRRRRLGAHPDQQNVPASLAPGGDLDSELAKSLVRLGPALEIGGRVAAVQRQLVVAIPAAQLAPAPIAQIGIDRPPARVPIVGHQASKPAGEAVENRYVELRLALAMVVAGTQEPVGSSKCEALDHRPRYQDGPVVPRREKDSDLPHSAAGPTPPPTRSRRASIAPS
jgi:hypothetical protein